MSSDHQQSDVSGFDEDLVAYLDGELDDAASRRLEERLNTDPEARRRLRTLATSWDLLDNLPKAAMDDSFTRTTVQLVAAAAADDVAADQAKAPARKRRRWIAGVAAGLAAAMIGFVFVLFTWQNPNEALLRDLPVIKNVEMYEWTPSIEFLRRLASEETFVGDVADDGPADSDDEPTGDAPISSEALAARRAELEALSPEQKAALRKQFERFQEKTPDERDRLRSLDAALRADPERQLLRGVLRSYYNWLPTVSPLVREDLRKLSADEAIDQIVRLKQEETRRLLGSQNPFTREDSNKYEQWVQDQTWKNKQDILEKAKPEDRAWFEELPPKRQRRALVPLSWRGPPSPPPASPEEWQTLVASLSRGVQDALKQVKPPDRQQRQLFDWHHKAMFARDAVSGGVSREELARFFQEKLTEKERENLSLLPPDEFQRELRRWYFIKVEAPPSWRDFGRRGGRGRGGHDGGRRGGFDRSPPPPHERQPDEPPNADEERRGERRGQREPSADQGDTRDSQERRARRD
jgi:hypothetical protein